MRNVLIGLGCGLIFGAGLLVSGMMQPSKVLAFLDLFGALGSEPRRGHGRGPRSCLARLCSMRAVAASRSSRRRAGGPRRARSTARWSLDRSCSASGWGLVGLCPGPAIENLATGSASVFVFVLAMIGGMLSAARVAPAQQCDAISARGRPGRIIADELLQSSTTLALIETIKSHIVAWARRGPPPHPIPLRAPLKPRRGPPPGGV